jgi:lipoate-protein ligase A
MCYTLILSYERDPALREIQSSFRFIIGRVRDCLLGIHPGVELAGTSDLAVAARKCSGNSQQRKRRFLLHHGTFLHAFDAKLVDRYLRMPARQPDYRLQRKHSEFLTNLTADSGVLRSCLMSAWNATAKANSWPKEAVRQLAESKYSQSEWTRRR